MAAALHLVRRNKITDQIMKQLIGMITSGELRPGERLPSERDLALEFSVSRTAMREAIRILAAQGLLDAQQGSGTFVRPAESWNALDPAILLAKGKNTAVDDLFEALEHLEPRVAALAALNASAEDLLDIERYDRLATTVDEHVKMDVGFHMAVARASHYRILSIMLNSVNELMRTSCRDNLGGQLQSVRDQVHQAHHLVFEAIRNGDAAGASEAMKAHLVAARANYRLTWTQPIA